MRGQPPVSRWEVTKHLKDFEVSLYLSLDLEVRGLAVTPSPDLSHVTVTANSRTNDPGQPEPYMGSVSRRSTGAIATTVYRVP